MFKPATHWCQTVFYLNESIKIAAEETLSGTIAVKKSKINFRNVDIAISFHYNGKEGKVDRKQLYKLT